MMPYVLLVFAKSKLNCFNDQVKEKAVRIYRTLEFKAKQ